MMPSLLTTTDNDDGIGANGKISSSNDSQVYRIINHTTPCTENCLSVGWIVAIIVLLVAAAVVACLCRYVCGRRKPTE